MTRSSNVRARGCGMWSCGVPSNPEIARPSTSVEGQPSCVERAGAGPRSRRATPGPSPAPSTARSAHLPCVEALEAAPQCHTQCLGHIDEMYAYMYVANPVFPCCTSMLVYVAAHQNIKLERPNRRPLSSLLSSANGRAPPWPRPACARGLPAENPPRPELVKPQTSVTQPSCTSQRACSGPADRSSQVK